MHDMVVFQERDVWEGLLGDVWSSYFSYFVLYIDSTIAGNRECSDQNKQLYERRSICDRYIFLRVPFVAHLSHHTTNNPLKTHIYHKNTIFRNRKSNRKR